MKVKELIKKLREYDGDVDVYFEYFDGDYKEFFKERVDYVSTGTDNDDDKKVILLESEESGRWKESSRWRE